MNEGCIPTKCLCHDAGLLNAMNEAADFAGSPTFDFAKAMARKEQVVNTLREGVAGMMQAPGLRLIEGTASFVDAHTLSVETKEGTETIEAKNVIVATGSVTKMLPISGVSLEGVLTSTDLLSIDHIPASLCIIGGGVIGLEFASIFNSFGTQVMVVEFCKEILPTFDADIAKRLRLALKKKGITFETAASVTKIERDGELVVWYEQKGKTNSVRAERALMAVGRAANLASMNFDALGLAYTRKGLTVDENMQTNVPGVYAVGDVNGLCQLAHAASFQGERALNHILGQKDNIRLDVIPAAVFSDPEAAMVGQTEQQCKEAGIDYVVHKSFYRANGKALSMEAGEGMAKIIATPDGQILGCHLYGAHAADLIEEVVVAMNAGLTLHRLAEIVHAHPTLSEVVLNAAQN